MDSGTSQSSNVWNTPVAVHPGPGIKMQPTTFTPLASSTAVSPIPFSDPFANDPDPFGPGTSSIDDLLGPSQSAPTPAASPMGDFFSTAIETPPVAAIQQQQRKVLVDPMQAFSFPPPSNGFNSSSTSDPMSSMNMNMNMNGGFNGFQGLGSMNEQHQPQQQQQQQQQAYQPFQPDFGTSVLMPGLMDQFPYQQQQQHQQPYSNGGMSNNNIPNSYPAPNQAMNGAFGAPFMHTPPPLPPSPPPIAPQFDQRQHNPFDAF